MIYIFKGPTPMNLMAGDIQTAVEAQIAPCEHAPTVQERQDGSYDFQTRPETFPEIHARLEAEHNVGSPVITDMLNRNVAGLDITPQPVKIGETRRGGTRRVHISPSIVQEDGGPITLTDFPNEFAFGNGVTCNSQVTLKDGSLHVLSWIVFPDAQKAVVESKYEELRRLVEGGDSR